MFKYKLKLNRLKKLSRLYSGLTGGEVIYQKLKENKVQDVFLYTGGAVMPLIDAFYQGDINYYINTHEQSGGHAAMGYAKSTNKPGVSIVTSGPGLTNSITPLTDATNDSVPLVLFSGQVPLKAMGTNAFQECPSVDITKPVTKWSYCVESVSDLPDVVDHAFKVATSGKKGAVHIDLPKCITSSMFTSNNKSENILPELNHLSNEFLDTSNMDKIAELINNSKQPIILLGQGCNNYPELINRLVEITSIPVTTTIHAMGVYDETNPLSLEFLGMHGSVAANQAVQNADLILALGTRFDDRTTGVIEKYAPKAFQAHKEKTGGIIHVNINNEEINKVIESHYNYNMDVKEFLDLLIPQLKKNIRNQWLSNNFKNKIESKFDYNKNNKGLLTQQVIEEIGNYLLKNNKDFYVSTGVGNHQMMAAQFIKWRKPKTYLSSGSLGVMGVGLPYAIGCQIANPKSLVIDIDGDGSFNHTLSELKTIQNYNLPVKIAIMNDTNLGMVRAWEELFFEENYTATDLIQNPDYCKIADSYDIMSIYCDSEEDLKKSIKEFLEYPDPILAEFKVVPDLCLPLVPPGKGLNEMITLNKTNNLTFSNELPPG